KDTHQAVKTNDKRWDVQAKSQPTEQPSAQTDQAQPQQTQQQAPAAAGVDKKKIPLKQRIEQARQSRADYFTPGNIVTSYGGHDEVISYTEQDNGGWSVKVHAVKKINGEWVRIGKPQDARTHSTQPDAQALKSGPLDKVSGGVNYTEPRSDGQPFQNVLARPVSQVTAAKPEIVTDKAEMRPYRKPDGSVGYEAVPIQAETPAEEPKVSLGSKAPGDTLLMGNGNTYSIDGIDTTKNKIRALRNPNTLGERSVLLGQDQFDKLVADDAETRAGQNDELDAEMQSYEAKKNPTYSGKPAAPVSKTETTAKPAPKPTPSANTIFTEDAAAAARARLKAKLGRLNSGLDPEMMMDGITLAGYHMEKGARTFTAFARAMVDDLGDAVKPYLKSWYSALRYDPRASGFSKGMSSAAMVDEFDLNDIAPATDVVQPDAATGKAEPAKPTLETTEGRHEIAKLVADHLITSKFSTIIEARKFITDKTGVAIEPGTDAAKRADEAIELGVVLASRDVVQAARKQGRSDAVIFDRLLGIYDNQPSLNVRDSVSLRNQAYSTPVPLAFVASRLAGVTPDKLAGEPSAGNGALMMEANPATSTTNEIQDDRLEALRSQGFNPTQNDAAAMKFKPKSLDVMVMNPPFGAVNGQKWTFGEFTTGEIDHAIVMNSLVAMKDDGSAVLIIGGTLAREDAARKDAYRGKAKREFFYKLYSEYNVVDHFTASGDLYKKQGAAYPVDVLVIRGRGKSARGLPAAQLPQLVDTWDQLKGKLNEMDGMGSQGPGNTRGGASNSNANNEPRGVPTPVVGPSATDGNGGRTGGTEPGIGTDDRGGPAATANSSGRANGAANPDGQRGNDAAPSQNGNTRKPAKQGSDQQQSSTASNRPDKAAGLDNRSDQQPDSPGIEEAAASGRLQVKYGNFSENRSVNTLVATNHLSAIESAFKALQARVGDIDEFVRAELQYEPEQFAKSFSAEQVEALALAIDNIGQGKGFIIGDQTGIGKGRVVAAMIRYAKLNGKVPVFVTQMPDLYGDMMRDLNDIGMTQTRPLMTNNNASVPLDAEALAWFSEKQAIQTRLTELQDEIETVVAASMGDQLTSMTPAARAKAISDAAKTSTLPDLVALREEVTEIKAAMPARRGKFLDTPDIKTHEAMLQQMVANNSIGDNDVIFTTYNQMAALDSGKPKKDAQGRKTPAAPPTFGYRNTFLKHFINANTMLILDESHNAGAASKDNKFPKLGDIVRGLINQSGGVFYSSATFAKNTEVMDVYSKTDLGSAFASPSELVRAVNSVPMQQITSAMLVEAGQYLRRERSFDGIDYKTETVEVDRQAAEDLATAMRLVVAFDAAKIAGIADIQNQLDAEGAAIATINGGGSAASVESTNFTSVMHNVVGTFLLALKADATATLAIDAIRAGEKPIITVANTMEMFITEYAKESGVGIGDKLNATFADVLKRYLDKTRKARIKHANGDTEIVWLTDAQLGVDGVDAYNAAFEFIEDMDMDIPLSPIDHIKHRIEEAGFSIGEITGRQTVLENGVLKGRNKAEMKTAGKKNTIAKYNGGPLDALIINRSGSTGLSMHASATFADQRRRVMIIAQAELDINNHMQMLGRTNRTGQVTTGPFDAGLTGTYQGRAALYGLPRYVQMTANVPIELRPAAVLSNKMAGLNANTTAGRKGAVQDQSALDFMNKYGDRVAAELVGSNFALNERLGFPIRMDDHGDPFIPGSMGRVTGRIGLLPLAQQTELYGQLATEYADLLAQLDALGQNELEAKTYPLDAETLERKVVQKADKGSVSPFTAAVAAEKVSMKKLGKPYPRAKVEELVQASLKGQEARELQRQTVARVTAQINAEILALQTEKPAANPERQATIDKHIDGLTAATLRFRQSLPPIGAEVLLKTSAGNMYGVVTGIEKTGKAKSAGSLSSWKIKFAVVDGARSMTLPLTQIFTDESAPLPENGIVMKAATDITLPNAERNGFETVPVMEAFDRGQTDTRETRIIITGNILRGYGTLRGRLLNYTDNKGGIKQGILMPPDLDMGTVSSMFTPALKNADEAITLLKKGGTVIDKANAGDTLRITWSGGESFNIEVSKTGLGKRLAKKAEGLNFVSAGNKMRVRVWSEETLKDFLENTAKPEGINLIPNADSVKLMNDDGAAFSRGASAIGMTRQSVQDITNAIKAQWANAPDIVVVSSMADPAIPQAVRDEDAKQKSMGATGEPEGFYHGGKVYVVAGEMNTASDVIRVLLHETLGHAGLRGVFGKGLETILRQIVTMRRKDIIAKARGYGLVRTDKNGNPVVDVKTATDAEVWAAMDESHKLTSAEEVLAEMSQTRPEIGFVTRAVAAIRAWLRKHVPGFSNLTMKDSEIIAQFLLPARRFIEGRGQKQQGIAGQLAFGRGKNGAMTNTNVVGNQGGRSADDYKPGDFKNSKVIDAKGNLLTVYHGTIKAFDKFDPEAEPYNYEGDRGKQFFLDSAKGAGEYAMGTHEDHGGNPNIRPVHLNIENPRIEHTDRTPSEWWDDNGDLAWKLDTIGKGHDGMIIIGDGETMYVTSNPDQIKSIFDRNESTAPDRGGAVFSRGTNEPMTNKDVVGNQGGRSADDTTPGDVTDFSKPSKKWGELFFGDATTEKVSELQKWLKQNPNAK
ncbi:strawberry notch-like NTP hydrolase domain-containing protein, partial [Acidithiobacillus sp.]|uniref:strawberry notch-like NTP hydrolase domain-containing protein n=1 Tax=Acidithiobacillus sp. TaxID=1872118 RepID=UPI002585D73C